MIKTRMEDWQDRRRHLESLGGASLARVVEIKVLDYLINRYRDSEIALLPARFALQTNVYWNDRGIVVNHHLAEGKVAGVKNHDEAEKRIEKLVQRMATDATEPEEFTPRQEVAGGYSRRFIVPPSFLRLRFGFRSDRQIERALSFSSILPKFCVDHLAARLVDPEVDDLQALDLFQQCRNRGILEESVRVWRARMIQGRCASPITEALEAQIRFLDNRPRSLELIRELLADKHAIVRMASARMLGKTGDLDDIGLLSDLLSLPQASDEAPEEREAIIAAMKTIAERSKK